ncbi:MAG: 16S rRNA (cytosine(1402)-N(4))-methyltransferase RsmH [Bdellovibrionales bacterium]
MSKPELHKPVLIKEVVEIASEVQPQKILDGTFGRGGHTRAFLQLDSRPRVVAIDQDLEAVQYGWNEFSQWIAEGRLQLQQAQFHSLPESLLAENSYDVILLDLGVSSPQLDDPQRGFSFYQDGPLDMRMNQSAGLTAADLVNSWPEVELIELFKNYGEIRRPQRVVRAIVEDRKTKPFSSTLQLAEMIARVEGWRRKGHHPATTYFLALRMAVNRELEGLPECLPGLMRALTEGGRLIVITFHSLEDRIIKYAFKESPELGFPLFKKVIVADREEVLENPRARSAKLRVFQRGVRINEGEMD